MMSPNILVITLCLLCRNSALVEKFVEQFPGLSLHVVLADFSLPTTLGEHRDVLGQPHQQVCHGVREPLFFIESLTVLTFKMNQI